MPKQEFDNSDRGYFAKNEERRNDRAPTHKGKITISRETLKALVVADGETGEAVLYLSGWPSKTKASMLSLKAELPMEQREGARDNARSRNNGQAQRGGGQRYGSGGGGRGVQPRRNDTRDAFDDSDYDDTPPFD